jgi:tetratricopeptide (TPR) repeat protein/serine/threonine protein kinase
MNEESIFLEALHKHTPEERAAFLDAACASDAELRRSVELLLKAHEKAGDFLHADARPSPTIGDPMRESAGSVIGPYKLLQPIGEGGMGTVWMAEQTQPVQRKVALKLIKPGMDSRQVIARFEAERQALALMEHPNIAKVLDAGTFGFSIEKKSADDQSASENRKSKIENAGRPYFVMELVKGAPITKYCDERRLTPKERLELFIPVCEAVQHAHQKGIIHRDLKPSNVLVALYDGKPLPNVIDFGVAKATGPKLTERTLFTEFGALVGTLEYMSPEQAELNQLDIDTRSDVYSLGVLLYELLTGTTPLGHERAKNAGLLEALRIIREEETPRPSARLSTAAELPSIAANRGLEPKKLSGLVRGELDWIVMKALEKDRSRRYETASALAADVQRYLLDEPVQACPPSAWYRFRKFARRNRRALTTVSVVLTALLVLAGSIGWSLWDQAEQRAEADKRAAQTERRLGEALGKTALLRDQALAMPLGTSSQAAAALVVWQQAADTLEQGEAALSTGAADEHLHQQLEDARRQIDKGRRQGEQRRAQALRREKLLGDLDEAHMSRMAVVGILLDSAGASAKYAAAFRACGLEVKPGQAKDLADRILAEEPAVRDALIEALDYWGDCALCAKKDNLRNELAVIADAADGNTWRRKFRAAASAHDGTALVALSAEARQLSLAASSLELLAWRLVYENQHHEAIELLRWARDRHRTDFWIPQLLGGFVLDRAHKDGDWPSPLEIEEALGCARAALALRPGSSAAYGDLGSALSFRKDWDQAIATLRAAIQIDSKNAVAHINLGKCLVAKGEFAKALAEIRAAGTIDPHRAEPQAWLGFALEVGREWNEALAAYHRALECDPKFKRALLGIGSVLGKQKKWDEAIAADRKAIAINPRYAKFYYQLGNHLRHNRQLDAAAAAYRKSIELNPRFADAYSDLGGLSYLRTKKDFDEAIKLCRKAIAIDRNLAPAYNNLGIALAFKKQLDDAVDAFRQAIDLDQGDPEPYCNLARIRIEERKFDEAIKLCNKAIAHAPKYAGAHNNLGVALRGKKRLKEATGAWDKAIDFDPNCAAAYDNLASIRIDAKQFDEAIKLCNKAIAVDPNYVQAYNRLGTALHGKKQLAEAIAVYGKAIALDPSSVQSLYNLSRIRIDQKQFDEAIALCRKAIALDPKYALGHHSLAFALYSKNQLDEAIDAYRTAIECDPDRPEAYAGLSLAVLAKNRPDDAIALCLEALAKDPQHAPAHNNLGLARRFKNQFHEAIEAYRAAIKIDPDCADSYCNLGVALRALNRLDEAIEAYRKAIKIDPRDARLYHNLGNALVANKQLDEAIDAFREAVKIDPTLGPTHFNLGNALAARNRLDEAIDAYRQAVKFDPKVAIVHYNLGRVLARKSRFEEAIAAFRKAIEARPDHAEAYCDIGDLQRRVGHFAESLAAFRRGHELGSKRAHWRYPSAAWVRHAEHLVSLEEHVGKFRKGEYKPKENKERLELIAICQVKRFYLTAATLYVDAFAAAKNLADDLQAGHRYNAARAATLAGTGQGQDLGQVKEEERARCRKQALGWLLADLAASKKQLQQGRPENLTLVQKRLQSWQDDIDLRGIRDAAALARLPADEQETCKKLWADVASVLRDARSQQK